MTPKISILMSVFNARRYLAESIDSLLSQTFQDFELLIMDDASTDGSDEILNLYRDARIVRLHNDRNIGLTASLNRLLTVARAPYIGRHDADDLSAPTRFERLTAQLDREETVGLVSSFMTLMDADGAVCGDWETATEPQAIQEIMLRANCVSGAALFRRECLAHMGGQYREQFLTAQDYDLEMHVLDRWTIVTIPEPLYLRREHAAAISTTRRSEQERHLRVARQDAIVRRLAWGKAMVGVGREPVPAWMKEMDRSHVAQRYLWWSAGLRQAGERRLALEFLAIAALLAPHSPSVWRYPIRLLIDKVRQRQPEAG